MKNRRSIRLKGYDYSQAGAYFVTICTQNRECLFGKITCPEMVLNDAVEMINRIWYEIPEYYPDIDVDAFQIMPNYIHGIIIVGAAPRGRPPMVRRGQNDNGQPRGVAPTATTLSLPDVVNRFKTMTTNEY